MKITTLHPCLAENYFEVSARLRREMLDAGHGESAVELAQEELIKSTSTWGHISDPARFADGIEPLINNLVGSGGQLGIRCQHSGIEFATDVNDPVAYRLRQWLGVLDRQVREVSDRQLAERIRYELRREGRPTFDVLRSQLATKKDLCVEDVVNLIVTLEPVEPFPFETQEIGTLTYIDLKYRRVLVLPTSWFDNLKQLYPFEVKDGKIVKVVKGAPHPISVIALRVLSEFAVDKEAIARLERRLVPFDWTSQSIEKSLREMAAEDEQRDKKADPIPQDRNDVTQERAVAAVESGERVDTKELTRKEVFGGRQLSRRGSVIRDDPHAVENATADPMFSKPTAVPVDPADKESFRSEGTSCDLAFRLEPKGKPMRDVKDELTPDVEEGEVGHD